MKQITQEGDIIKHKVHWNLYINEHRRGLRCAVYFQG